MKKIYTLLLLAFCIGMSSLHAQTPSLKAYQKSAKKAMAKKDFYSAWKYNSIALQIDSSRIDNMYNLAESARQFKSYNVARDAYQEVLASEDKSDYPLAELWLASVYHSQAEYSKAVTHYQQFLDGQVTSKGPSDEMNTQEFTALAQKSIQDCNWASEQIQSPKTGFIIQKFGADVNTASTEFAPLEHQSQVYYSALEYDDENFCPNPDGDVTRLYTSTTVDSGQPSAINWSKEEKGKFVAHTAFNESGSRIYFTVCNRLNASEFGCEIYYRDKNNTGMWGDAVRLPEHINQFGSTSTQPSIGFDKNTGKELLFFVTDRADAVGGKNGDLNIYCSMIEADGQVNVPVKLNINSEEDDITPFFNKENNTLYFSSKGYKGFGGFDIYKTEKLGSDFGNPVAMEYPLNTSYDDIYFSTDEKFEHAYFSSNRLGVTYEEKDMETCCNDIFKLEMILVNLITTDFNILNEANLDSCSVALYDVASGEEIKRKLDPNGNLQTFELDLESEYMIVSSRDGGWTMDTVFVSTKGIKETTTIERMLKHRPAVDLFTNTFDKQTDLPLEGCTFNFYNEVTGELIGTTTRMDDNEFYSTLDFGVDYKVVATKPYYTPDSVSFNTRDLFVGKTFRFPLYLECEPDGAINLSVVLFFDNDEPDKRTRAITTSKTYREVWTEYVKDERIEKFLSENGNNLSGEMKLKAQDETRLFFDEDVKQGMTKLDLFAGFLERYIPQGRIYQIEIEGFASPRAPSEYNKKLTSRRVSSVENYLRSYNGGVLAQHIGANKSLRFILIPRGEDPSEGLGIPSDYSDPKSIYSIAASKQRKVELVRIKRIDGGCDVDNPNKDYLTPKGGTPTPNPSSGVNVDLVTNTFVKGTNSVLTGCTFKFIDESTGASFETERLDDNRFYNNLEFGKRYRVVASKAGYSSDEISFSTKDLSTSKTFTFPLYLETANSGANLPVILYFDNDEPDKRTRATTTSKTYQQAYQAYVKEDRVSTFVQENSKSLSGETKIKAQDETRIFFDSRVREGMNRLEMLGQFLERNLPQGRKYQIELEGFASPRAPSAYNKSLTSRRVSSVENYLRQYNGGVLASYIGYNKGLTITLVPRGEQASSGLGIPDNYSDPKSIYSIEASEQRKVTIIRIKSLN